MDVAARKKNERARVKWQSERWTPFRKKKQKKPKDSLTAASKGKKEGDNTCNLVLAETLATAVA